MLEGHLEEFTRYRTAGSARSKGLGLKGLASGFEGLVVYKGLGLRGLGLKGLELKGFIVHKGLGLRGLGPRGLSLKGFRV